MNVSLRPVTDANLADVVALRTTPAQEQFVSGVARSLIDAATQPEGRPWIRAVVADDVPVGFTMVSWDVIPVPDELWGPFYLWRLLIDERHQRRGYGSAAVALVADAVRAGGADVLFTSCGQGDGSPQPFYERLGFVQAQEKGVYLLMERYPAAVPA